MNIRSENTKIGDIVTALPQSKDFFSKHQIDFCCGGHRKLSEVIDEQNLNADEIYHFLELLDITSKKRLQSDKERLDMLSPGELTAFIENKHHGFLRASLPSALELLGTLLSVHGKNHTELYDIYRLFGRLKTELEQHLIKEEELLFPEICSAKDIAKIRELAEEIVNEHVSAGEILKALRTLTNNYTPPSDGCATYAKAFELLEYIEADLHEHIHLENNILLKNYDTRK